MLKRLWKIYYRDYGKYTKEIMESKIQRLLKVLQRLWKVCYTNYGKYTKEIMESMLHKFWKVY